MQADIAGEECNTCRGVQVESRKNGESASGGGSDHRSRNRPPAAHSTSHPCRAPRERRTGVGAGRSNRSFLRAPGLCEPAGCAPLVHRHRRHRRTGRADAREHRDERGVGAPGGGVFERRLPGDCLRSARLGPQRRRSGDGCPTGARLRGPACPCRLPAAWPHPSSWRRRRRVRGARLRRMASRPGVEPRCWREHGLGQRSGGSRLHRTNRDSRHPISAGSLPRGERIVSRRQPRRHEALARDRTSGASAERASYNHCDHRTRSRS